jgi:2-polyprenyl-6-methoxyphenol hydroxylase-like FAD-dependent oxidoreductase
MIPSERPGRRVLIIGCGIAGPVLAVFLQRAGMEPIVYEAAAEPRDDEGAFLQLAPMGVNVLETLGITGDEIVAAGGFPDLGIVFHNSGGDTIAELDGTEAYGAKSYVIKRGRLAKLLRETAIEREITVTFDAALKDVETADDGTVSATFEDGTIARGDLLVGCDGVHSKTRRLVMPSTPTPEYTGMIDCGGFTARPSSVPASSAMHMTYGKRAFFGYLAKPDDEVYWFDNLPWPTKPERGELDTISNEEWKQRLTDAHMDDPAYITEIVRSTDGEIGAWPLYDLSALDTWHEGAICLIGDAAHATPPHNGHGASMALEDAIVLAKCLRDVPDLERSFERFEGLRKERVEKVATQARRIGKQKTMTSPVKRWLRDRMLPIFLTLGTNSMDWLFEYRVEWEQRLAR